MNRTREWVSAQSMECPSYEMLSNEMEHSIPDWLARIEISSNNGDESIEFPTPMEVEYPNFENKLG